MTKDTNAATGDGINAESASWSFEDTDVVNSFDDHVSKSVPLYDVANSQVISMLPFFFRKTTTNILDFGCSTGHLLDEIQKTYNNRDLSLKGYDVSEKMVNHAKQHRSSLITFTTDDLLTDEVENIDVYLSMYTLQFVHPEYRLDYLTKIYNSLNWGGALFFYEKTRAPDARFQDIFTTSYFKYKEKQGYSPANIYSKFMSLEGILEPFSVAGNEELLKLAGFKDICSIFKYAPFQGWLCIK